VGYTKGVPNGQAVDGAPVGGERQGLEGEGLGWRVARSAGTLVVLVVVYYALPLGRLDTTWQALAIVLGLVIGVVVLTFLAGAQIRRLTRAGDDEAVRVEGLVAVVYLVILVFAGGYYALEHAATDQFDGLETKTDALYFTVSTLATVGFGDVHATGQVARALVTLQMVFNLVVVGALVTILTGHLRRRAEARRHPPGEPGPT
jgi:voltage-gated potassium channel